jgi:hypothetical protein
LGQGVATKVTLEEYFDRKFHNHPDEAFANISILPYEEPSKVKEPVETIENQ